MRWKALAEIYTMHLSRCTPLHHSLISICSLEIAECFADFLYKQIVNFARILLNLCYILTKTFWDFFLKMQRTFRSLPKPSGGTKEVLRDRYQFRWTLHLANTPPF